MHRFTMTSCDGSDNITPWKPSIYPDKSILRTMTERMCPRVLPPCFVSQGQCQQHGTSIAGVTGETMVKTEVETLYEGNIPVDGKMVSKHNGCFTLNHWWLWLFYCCAWMFRQTNSLPIGNEHIIHRFSLQNTVTCCACNSDRNTIAMPYLMIPNSNTKIIPTCQDFP